MKVTIRRAAGAIAFAWLGSMGALIVFMLVRLFVLGLPARPIYG